ncbi:MAG: TonB family protein [Nitrospinales bacterium]|jgi:TonB family protein
MMKNTQRGLNYPLAISLAIHGLIIAFFSFLSVNLPKKIAEEPPIHIKNIIFEKKKTAPARETNNNKSVKAHKPTRAAQSFRNRKRTPIAQAKPLPRNTEPLNKFVPINRVPEKPNRFHKTDLHPIAPISFVHKITQPATYVATNYKPKLRLTGKVKPKSFSGSFSVSAIEPVRMAVTTENFSPKPFGKPMQITTVPKGFVNYLPSENSLAKLSPKATPGIKHGVINSNGDDLKALRKGYSSQIWRRVADAKFYPRTARKREMEGKPIVEFELRSDGQLMNYFIVRSSSNKILDKAAIDAVKNASPYPGIPKLLKLKSIRFKLPISFILNEP